MYLLYFVYNICQYFFHICSIFVNICMYNIFQYLSIFMMLQELATNPDNLLLFTSLVVTTVFVAQVESWELSYLLTPIFSSLSIEENGYLFFVWRQWLTINTFIISALFLCPLWHISSLSSSLCLLLLLLLLSLFSALLLCPLWLLPLGPATGRPWFVLLEWNYFKHC